MTFWLWEKLPAGLLKMRHKGWEAFWQLMFGLKPIFDDSRPIVEAKQIATDQ
jgi:hypothetical protein